MYTFNSNLVSDLHKDAYGFRPSALFKASWILANDGEKQIIWDNLIAQLEKAVKEQNEYENQAIGSFEFQIKALMESNKVDRKEAIKLFVETLELSETDKMYGGEYICYKLGLPYNMSSEFEGV